MYSTARQKHHNTYQEKGRERRNEVSGNTPRNMYYKIIKKQVKIKYKKKIKCLKKVK